MEDTMLKERVQPTVQFSESQEDRKRRLMHETSVRHQETMIREKEEIAQIKKKVKGEKEEFVIEKYVEIRTGKKPPENLKVGPIVYHSLEAGYYLSNPKIKTIEEFVEHQDYMES